MVLNVFEHELDEEQWKKPWDGSDPSQQIAMNMLGGLGCEVWKDR
jgi:hypothetical protein